jgi:predicted nuclease with TOPRIM domain
MDFEQTTDKDKVEELARERAFLTQELNRATSNVQTLQRRLDQCNEEIISLTDRNNINRSAAINLASKMSTQTLISVIIKLEVERRELESLLSVFLPERAQKARIEISERAERIEIYCQVYRSRMLGKTC